MKEITLNITNKCNKHCSFCYQKHGEKFIDSETALSFLNKYNDEDINLTLFGGEPFENKEFIKCLNNNSLNNKINLLIYSNMELLDISDIIELFGNFKSVEIRTNIDNIFNNELFYKTDKIKKIKFIRKNFNVIIRTHSVLTKEILHNIETYLPKLIKMSDELKNLGIIFTLEFPSSNDYSPREIYNLLSMFYYLGHLNIFSSEIHNIYNFFNKENQIKHSNECNPKALNEITMDVDSSIYLCRRLSQNKISNEKIDEILNNSLECKNCNFNNICDVCKFSYFGDGDNKKFKCKRISNIMDGLNLYLNLGPIKLHNLYNYQVIITNKCNKQCSFCYFEKNNQSSKPEDIEMFIKSNFWYLDELDSIIGGEPLIELDFRYDFLKKYVDNAVLITNLSIKNKYVQKNHEFFKLKYSIHDGNIDSEMIDYYYHNLYGVNLTMSNETISKINEIIKKCNEYDNIQVIDRIELYRYSKNDNIITNKNRIVNKSFNNVFNIKKKKYNTDNFKCFRSKICINIDKITVCNTLFLGAKQNGEEEQYILFNKLHDADLSNINLEEKIPNGTFDETKCIASIYEEDSI